MSVLLKQPNLFTKPAKTIKPVLTPESKIQENLFGWIFANERRFPILKRVLHVPNGGHRYKATAAAMKRQGARAGVLDVHLPVARRGYVGLWIELKRADGEPSDVQNEWIEFLKSENHLVHVSRCWIESANIIIDYLELNIAKIPSLR